MTMRAFSPRSSMLRTLPSSSMMPVNISNAFHHLFENLVNRFSGGVNDDRIAGNLQRRIGAGGVAPVTLDHVRECLCQTGRRTRNHSIFFETAFCSFLRQGS